MERICYLEDLNKAREAPPGCRVGKLTAAKKEPVWWKWLGTQRGKCIVYRERCHLRLEDLELVSFLPGGASFGVWCWCDLFVELTDPAALLGALGTEEADGQYAVSLEALASWFREPLAQALEAIGARGDLAQEAYWPTISQQVAQRLGCPAGVVLDHSRQQETPPQSAFVLRKVRSFKQYSEELRLRIELEIEIRRLLRDGALAEAFQAVEGGNPKAVEQLLKTLEQQNFDDLLTPEERKLSAGGRLSSYIELVGTRSDSVPRPGVVIGRYKLLTQLGQGGQGQVWKAWEATGERFVVLKLVPPAIQNATDEMNRLKATFKIIQGLQHSNICPVILLEQDPRFGWYQVMKYVDGQTLLTYGRTFKAKHGSFPLDQVVKVLRPVAEALDYAHRQNVVHRDIKPENILVTGAADDVQVVDFGLAAAIRTSMSRISQSRREMSGTPPYMAPEQWRGDSKQDARTDQYALAVVAYELLAGRLPFQSDDFDILRACVLNDPPRPLEDQPDAVNRALMRGLAKRREERYKDCRQFVRAIDRVLRRPATTLEPSSACEEIKGLSKYFCEDEVGHSARVALAKKVSKLAAHVDVAAILDICRSEETGHRIVGLIALTARLKNATAGMSRKAITAVLRTALADAASRVRYRAIEATAVAPYVHQEIMKILGRLSETDTNEACRILAEEVFEQLSAKKGLRSNKANSSRRNETQKESEETCNLDLSSILDEIEEFQLRELKDALDQLEHVQNVPAKK